MNDNDSLADTVSIKTEFEDPDREGRSGVVNRGHVSNQGKLCLSKKNRMPRNLYIDVTKIIK